MSSSRTTISSSRHLEIEVLDEPEEDDYPARWSLSYINETLLHLHDDTLWNSLVCAMVLIAIVIVAVDFGNIFTDIFDIVCNIVYAAHVLILAYGLMVNSDDVGLNLCTASGFLIDVITFSHYILDCHKSIFKLICYYLRLHRPFRYLWSMNDNNLQSSVLGTTLKYCYIFLVFRLTWALIWLHIDELESQYTKDMRRAMTEMQHRRLSGVEKFDNSVPRRFLSAVYVVNKMFIPIGPSVAPTNDLERIACLLVMLTGCLVVTGAAVASLSLVISIYMRPEETFRTRYRLIMKEMVSNIPPSLRAKVEKFYKMYWHKQRAVSVTQLLPIFPPSFTSTIYTDIYFKTTQKCRILRDLSYQFLSEIAKKMATIHYIPGDAIIRRDHKKSYIIYITYGDVEMLTAEDDATPILRMIRGTILSPCAGSPISGCGRSHVEIRAATFCTAHVLDAVDLWRVVLRYGKKTDQGVIVLKSFYEHFEKVKRNYNSRYPEDVKYKSSIFDFKRNIMELKKSKDADGNQQLSQTDLMLEVAGCYIMRNRADASLTDEADGICLRPTFPCILQPKSSLQVAWNCFVTCLIVAVCITHPYYLVYKMRVPLEFRFYDYAVTVVYVVDLIVHLSTGANVEEGVPITFAQTSSQQARNKWFVLDVIGTLPIFEFIHNGHFAGINKLLRLPKVFRTLKTIEDECVYYSNFLRFMSYSLLLLFACYLLAALQQGFMCFQFGYCLVSNFTHSPYWEKKPLDEETVENRITFGIYWAISMITFTTHLETWGIENWNNVLYTMFVLEICIVLYIFIEAVYSATIMVTTALREDFDACVENVTSFLIRNEVCPTLRQRFIDYLQLRWYTDKAYSITNKQTSIFYDLPPHVYQDIVTRQRSKYILCIPFMKLLNKEDLKDISSKAKLFCTSPNEILLSTGDMINEMYVIKRGICEILSPVTKDVVGELNGRSHFGVFECLLRLPAFYTIRAVTYVEVFSISRKYLLEAIDIPQIKDAIQFTKEEPKYSDAQIRREPFISYQPPKPTPNVEKFRVPRKFEQDNAYLQPFYRLGLLSVLRYIFPRFTIRPDGSYVVRYEWFRGCCAVASAVIYPGYTYMVLQWPWLYFVTVMLDLTAYFDILQRMLIGYYNERGVLVYHPASTAAHYFRGAFLVDLFGCLPLERLESSWKESFQDKYKEAPTKQFLMLNRLLQLYRMPSALLGLTGLVRRDLFLVIKAIPLFLALLNVLTCLVVYCSANIFYTTSSNAWFIVPHDDEGGSWIRLFESTFRFNLTESPWNIHLGSYFWVVYETTTTGYSSFKPTNFNLMRVLIFGMIVGALMTTYFSVRIISIRANVNKALASFQENIKDIWVFMKREKLDPKLQKQVLEYYEYNWDKMGGLDYRNVLKLCEQITLRTDAILHIYGPTFSKCPILNQCDLSLLRIIGRTVRSFYFMKNTTIIEKDDIISDIYIVDQGTVELPDPSDANRMVALTEGSMFGNLEDAMTIRSPSYIKTSSQVHLLQINSQAFFRSISDFPGVTKLLDYYRPANENYIIGLAAFSQFNISERSATFSSIIRGRGFFHHFNVRQSIIRIYLIVVSLCCIYGDVYNAGFQDNRPILILFLYSFDFCFLLKFLIQYFLSQIVEVDDDEILRNTIKMRKKYFKTEFKYDVLSLIPIEIFCLISKSNSKMVFSWLRLNRLLRVVTVYKCLKRHHKHLSINLTITTIITVIIWFTLFVHVSACLWYFIGVLEEYDAPKSSWIYNDKGKPWCHNYYICSLYFVLTTFTQNGVGDILPKKQSEVIFVSILQLISTMMYMVYVGELSNIIQYQSFRSFYFYSSYLELQEFLKNNRVSKNLVSIVNKYSLHLWRESRGLQVPYFLTTAPSCLKLKVMSAAYLKHLADHQLFKGCEPAFLRQLVGFLQLYTYNDDMFVVKKSEITDSMYIIHTGRVWEYCDNSINIRSYHAGDYFGELQGLNYNLPHTRSYKTSAKSQILTLHLKDWEDLLKHFPKSKDYINEFLERNSFSSSNGGDSMNGGIGSKEHYIKTSDKRSSPHLIPSTSKHSALLSTSLRDNNLNVKKVSSDKFELLPSSAKGNEESKLNESYIFSTTNKRADSVSSSASTYEIGLKSPADIKIISKETLTDNLPMKEILKIEKEKINIEDSDIRYSDNINSDDLLTLSKSTYELKSVEDYITEKHGKATTSKDSDKKQVKKPTSIDLKKRKTHVSYNENESTPNIESHELKPIINLAVDEKNLKSLDSDMQPQNIDESDPDEDSQANDSS